MSGIWNTLMAGGQAVLTGHRGLTSLLLLASALGGSTAGWLAAKATSHTDSDINLAKKEYENEQVKADIGYLSQKLNHEFNENQNANDAKKSVRLLNA